MFVCMNRSGGDASPSLDKSERSKALEQLRLSVREKRIETETQIIAEEQSYASNSSNAAWMQADPLPNGEVVHTYNTYYLYTYIIHTWKHSYVLSYLHLVSSP